MTRHTAVNAIPSIHPSIHEFHGNAWSCNITSGPHAIVIDWEKATVIDRESDRPTRWISALETLVTMRYINQHLPLPLPSRKQLTSERKINKLWIETRAATNSVMHTVAWHDNCSSCQDLEELSTRWMRCKAVWLKALHTMVCYYWDYYCTGRLTRTFSCWGKTRPNLWRTGRGLLRRPPPHHLLMEVLCWITFEYSWVCNLLQFLLLSLSIL